MTTIYSMPKQIEQNNIERDLFIIMEYLHEKATPENALEYIDMLLKTQGPQVTIRRTGFLNFMRKLATGETELVAKMVPVAQLKYEADKIPWSTRSLTDDEMKRLRRDIKKNGIKVPLIASTNGYILDGLHRWTAALELEMEEVPVIYTDAKKPEEVKAVLLSANVYRRHLSTDDMLEILGAFDKGEKSKGGRPKKTESFDSVISEKDLEVVVAKKPKKKSTRQIARELTEAGVPTSQSTISRKQRKEEGANPFTKSKRELNTLRHVESFEYPGVDNDILVAATADLSTWAENVLMPEMENMETVEKVVFKVEAKVYYKEE